MAKRLPAIATALGFDANDLCLRHGIEPEALVDRTARVPLDPVLAGLEEVLTRSGHPALALKLAIEAEPDVYHTPGLILMASETLEAGFARAFEFQRLWGDGDRFSLATAEEVGVSRSGLVVAFRIPARRRIGHGILEVCALAETMLAARLLTGRPEARALDVTLPSTTDAASALEDFFGCKPIIGAPLAAIVLSPEIASLPLVHAHSIFLSIFERQASEELGTLPPPAAFLRATEGQILRGLAQGQASLSHCAAALGISTRTLERRLSEHGTTFQALLDGARRARALRLLREGFDVEEAALLLGYAERSSFHRACLRWFGKTPGQLRGG